MLSYLLIAIKIIVLLGFLIFIHELGHFTVAKLCKVKVNEFAIGFGPTILKKQGKETKYALRLIPLGGFVSMEGEEEASENEGSFSKASIPKKIAIVIAGATVNIIFAIIVYFILSFTSGTYISNEIKLVQEGYAASQAGLQQGEKIVEINNHKISSKYDLDKVMKKNKGEEIELKTEKNGQEEEYKITPTQVKNRVTGIYLDDKCKIVTVEKGSVAQKQGIETNDTILKINGISIDGNRNTAIEALHASSANENIEMTVKRGKTEVTISLTPDVVSTYYLGIELEQTEDNFTNRFINGEIQTKEFVLSIFDNLKQLFTGKVGLNQMMGPVGISEAVAQTNGFREFFEMMALISLSLGVTNLLPIPALDGGKFVLLLVEAIRKKPLKPETEMNIQILGIAIILTIFLLVTYNDILRIF